ncbi:hypothetical protein F4703DRAFT_1913567 [Phycomyces blakesleeanus]
MYKIQEYMLLRPFLITRIISIGCLVIFLLLLLLLLLPPLDMKDKDKDGDIEIRIYVNEAKWNKMISQKGYCTFKYFDESVSVSVSVSAPAWTCKPKRNKGVHVKGLDDQPFGCCLGWTIVVLHYTNPTSRSHQTPNYR